MHVLIEAVGSAGDVHPFLTIGQALKARGHEVDIVTSIYFADRVAQAGLGFIPVGTLEDYRRAIAQTDLWHPRRAFEAVWRESKRQLLPVYDLLCAHLRPDETVLVGSTLAWSVRLVQERLGTPTATVHLAPACILSADAPPRLAGLGGWFAYLPRRGRSALLNWLERKFLDGVVRDDLNVMRAQIGLPQVRNVFSHWQHSPQLVICAFPDWFCALQADWPRNSMTIGFPLWRGGKELGNDGARERTASGLSAALDRFLAAGAAPIGFTPGSAMAFGQPFFEHALKACEKLGRRAVFITPFTEQLPWGAAGAVPEFVHHETYTPFDLLVPRLAAFVHHGGIGTTAQTMAAGVPQLITPFAHDQFDNAARVARLGCGAQISLRASPRKWASALSRLLDSTEVAAACRQVSGLMADQQGVLAQIVTRIEALREAHQGAAS